MPKYLDDTGLAYLWGKLKTYIANAVKVTGVKGNSENSYRTGNVNLTAANVGAVATSGNETVAGQKTFSGKTTLTHDSICSISTNTDISPNPNAIIQSAIPKYLWHDRFAFCRTSTPTYYVSSDNQTWVESPLNKKHFAQLDNLSITVIKKTGQTGARWVWNDSSLYASYIRWFLIGIAYTNPFAVCTFVVDGSTDGQTWTELFNKTITTSGVPHWLKLNASNAAYTYWRLTITKDPSDTTSYLNIGAIKALSCRWGDQGKGSEYEYPYDWDENRKVTFIDVAATTINGVTVGSSPKFTDTTYSNASGSAAGLMSSNDYTKLAGIEANADQTWFLVQGTDNSNRKDVKQYDIIKLNNAAIARAETPSGSGFYMNTLTIDTATDSQAGLMSSTDHTKLTGIAQGAEVNQNAFSSVKVGNTTISAGGKTSILELFAGSNITLTPDTTNGKVTIAASGGGGSGSNVVITYDSTNEIINITTGVSNGDGVSY